jgi:hypothetical protein
MHKRNPIYIVLLILAFIFSLVGWFSLEGVLFNGSATTGVIIVAAFFLMLGAVLGFLFLLYDSFWLLILAPVVSVVAFLIFFGPKPIYLAVAFVGLALVALAAREAMKEKKAHIKVMPKEIVKPALGAIFTLLALLISAVIYFSPPAQQISVDIKVPRALFNFVVTSMTSVAPSSLIPIDQVLDQATQEKLYLAINNQINFFLQPYKKYLPYGLAVAVFLSLKAVSFIFVWMAMGMIQFAYVLARKLKLIAIRTEMTEREIIDF